MQEPPTTPAYDLVRERLTKTRRREGWSLRDVAERTNLSAATLSRFEQRKGVPDLPTIEVLVTFLELDRADVFNAQEEAAINTPAKVRAHLRADKNLDTRTAEMLAESFEVLYKRWAGDPTQ